jgi:hypothetical protein
MMMFLFLEGARGFSLRHKLQTGSEAYPASYPVGTGGSFPGGKAAESEDDLSPSSNAEIKNCGVILPLPHTSSWRGA